MYSEMYSTSEYEIIREMTSFKESILLLNLNYTELKIHFENFRKTTLKIFSEEHPERNINIETKRLIHNYLSSTVSLIDHTRVYVKKLHTTIDFDEYQLKINKTFIQNSICVFVKDFRQYVQHVKLPDISYRKNVAIIKPHASMAISKEELLKFSGWTKMSKEYIYSHSGSIDLRMILKDYQLIVDEFYVWLISWQENIFKEQIKKIQHLKLSIIDVELKAIIQKIINQEYKNHTDLERDLYDIIPEKTQLLNKLDNREKISEIFYLFNPDNLTKFRIITNLEALFNQS